MTGTEKPVKPLAVQLAQASWIAPLLVVGINRVVKEALSDGGATRPLIFALFSILLFMIGFGCGVAALLSVRRHGRQGILIPALIGTTLSAGALAIVGITFANAIERNNPQAELERVAAKMQSELPKRVQPDVELTRVAAGDGRLEYHYTLINHTIDQVDAEMFERGMRAELKREFCSRMELLWKHDMSSVITYTSADGGTVCRIVLDGSDCRG